jgi:hypothetical protein
VDTIWAAVDKIWAAYCWFLVLIVIPVGLVVAVLAAAGVIHLPG